MLCDIRGQRVNDSVRDPLCSYELLLTKQKMSYFLLFHLFILRSAVTSRRGDLEILGYVMLQWLCDRLPWEKNLADKEYVRSEKTK